MANVLIPQASGTAIGNMTENGGLAAGFDGNNSQNQTACARISASVNGFIGKDWGVGVTRKVAQCKLWSSNSDAWSTLSNGGTITVTLQGSTDNFSASTVDIGSTTGSMGNTATETLDFNASDLSTAYRYHRVKLASSNGSENWVLAEVEFYEAGAGISSMALMGVGT